PDRVRTAELVPTLEAIRDRGRAAVAELLPELDADLAAYRVAERAPLAGPVAGHELLTTPEPSRGGRVVLDILQALDAAPEPALGDVARAIGLAYGALAAGRLPGTTHVSVVDEQGTAAALSMTLGSGSGVFRGGTQLNNMLGELDVIGAVPRGAGARLPSMMAPTIALAGGRPRLVLGSAGSLRRACTRTAARCTSRAGGPRTRSPGSPTRGTSSAGATATSSSAGCPRSRPGRTGRWTPPATRAAGGTGWLSRDPHPPGRAGRRGGALPA